MGQGQGASAARSVRLWVPVVLGVVILALVVALIAGRDPGADTAQPAVTPDVPAPVTTQPTDAAEPASPDSAAAAEPTPDTTPPDLSRRLEGDPTALGAVDAPVVIVEYADYRCPYCAKFGRETMPTLVEEYVDSGQVRVEWRDMPIFGAESELVAMAGRAAANQDRFWEFNAAVFAAAPESGHPDLDRDDLLELAGQAEVADLAAFERDLEDPELRDAVRADSAEGQAIGVTSVPAFVVGGTSFLGAQPIEIFREVIDAELAAAG